MRKNSIKEAGGYRLKICKWYIYYEYFSRCSHILLYQENFGGTGYGETTH